MIRANHNTSVEHVRSLPESPPGLLQLWQLARRQLHWIAVGAVAGIVLAGTYCLMATPVYQSDATILVNKKNPQVPQVSSEGQSEIAIEEDLLATHMEIMLSSEVIGVALRESGMDQAESVLSALDDDQTQVDYVRENLNVTKGGDGASRLAHTLNVSFRHTSASDCETILNSLITSYCKFVNDTQKKPTELALTLLQKTRGEAQAKLDQLHADNQAFLVSTKLSWNGQETNNVHRELAAKLDEQLSQLRRQRIDVRTQLDAMLAVNTASTTKRDLQRLALIEPEHLKQIELMLNVHRGDTGNQQQTIGRFEDNLEKLKGEKDDLMRRFNVDHPRVKQVSMAIQRTENLINTKEQGAELKPSVIVHAYMTLLRSKLNQLETQERLVAREQQREASKATALVQHESKQNQMRAELDQQQQFVLDLNAEIAEKLAALEYEGFINTVIKSVELGEQVSPRLALLLVVGLFLGSGLGTCIGVIRDQTQSPARNQRRDYSPGRLDTERSRFEMSDSDHFLATVRSSQRG